MGGIKNRGTQVHKVKTKYKRDKKVELPEMDKTEEKFLEKIISNIPDSFPYLMEYGFASSLSVKKLLTDSFKKGGADGLVKELENHNFFIVFQDDDLPSNYSLVSEYNWCVLFWNNMGIEDYTFFVMEYPDEFKIYLHKTTSEIRQYSEPISEPIKSCSLKTDIGEVFEKTVTDYMVDVFWYELEHALEVGGGQKFLEEMEAGEFSKEFNMGAFFNFDGIDLPKRIKEKAFQKILQNVEDSPDEV